MPRTGDMTSIVLLAWVLTSRASIEPTMFSRAFKRTDSLERKSTFCEFIGAVHIYMINELMQCLLDMLMKFRTSFS